MTRESGLGKRWLGVGGELTLGLSRGLRRGLLSGLLSTTSGAFEVPIGGGLLVEALALFAAR